jgi:hypothetical protein
LAEQDELRSEKNPRNGASLREETNTGDDLYDLSKTGEEAPTGAAMHIAGECVAKKDAAEATVAAPEREATRASSTDAGT